MNRKNSRTGKHGRNGLGELSGALARFRWAKAMFETLHKLHVGALSVEDAARIWVTTYGNTFNADMKLLTAIRLDTEAYLHLLKIHVAIKHEEKK